MECITPGIQKHRVKNIFNINAPILPVVNMASGGSKKHRKYLMAIKFKSADTLYHCLEYENTFLLPLLITQIQRKLFAEEKRFEFRSIIRQHFASQYKP